jgi:glucose/arabinose dehydrogenase
MIAAVKLCAVVALGVAGVSVLCAQLPPVPSGATAVAQGLFGPRGLKVGPDGNLYVALSGPGGTNSVPDACLGSDPSTNDVPAYTNGNTASIVKVDKKGNVTTVANGFPSALSTHPDVEGVADVAFLDGQLYAVTAGGGCSHGTLVPQMVARVDQRTGKWTMIANMSQQLAAHPAAVVGGDYDPDGLFYSMIAWQGKLYAVEANHGQIWSVTPNGQVQMVTDISKAEGHVVPTAVVSSGEDLIVGNLGLFPITPDSETLTTLAPSPLEGLIDLFDPWAPDQLHVTGTSSPGLTTVVSMAWGPDGALYVLELSAAAGFPTPGDGKVVRVKGRGMAEDVITGLSVPTGMTFGPDGALYVSNWGAADAPIGQILRFKLH